MNFKIGDRVEYLGPSLFLKGILKTFSQKVATALVIDVSYGGNIEIKFLSSIISDMIKRYHGNRDTWITGPSCLKKSLNKNQQLHFQFK